tara:strand:+ start:334 stop:771 length:438 start_codon:yes stop_codon:yes gene_type:complete
MTTLQEKNDILVCFLQRCGIVCSDYSHISSLIIPRVILLHDEKYKDAIEYIPAFKKMFSSSYLTSLQNTAGEKQRWPLLNIVRQILKEYNFKLTPKRLSNGYTKDKKKLYRRVFIIEILNSINSGAIAHDTGASGDVVISTETLS